MNFNYFFTSGEVMSSYPGMLSLLKGCLFNLSNKEVLSMSSRVWAPCLLVVDVFLDRKYFRGSCIMCFRDKNESIFVCFLRLINSQVVSALTLLNSASGDGSSLVSVQHRLLAARDV